MTRPPLATTVWPVVKLERSDARNNVSSAMSSGVPMRASGVASIAACRASGLKTAPARRS